MRYDTLRDAGLGYWESGAWAPHGCVRGSGDWAACARWDGGLRGARRGGGFAGARWRLPSRRVGLLAGGGVSDGVLGDDRVFTCRCVAAQLGSPQDAPSWSGLPKQLGHARPRAHMLAEASFPRRYPGRASPVRDLSGGPYTP